MTTLRREIHPEVKILDAAKGILEYVASDQTVDSYREVIRADGWRFNRFRKNAPFVDSHDYHTIEKLLGKVLDFRVVGRRLVETVQWAKDVPENTLAQIGWNMTEAGYLKAVSVGFFPVRTVRPHTQGWREQLSELGLSDDAGVRAIYVEQEQIELSACVVGANPNALAKAYKAGALSDTDLDLISTQRVSDIRGSLDDPDPNAVLETRRRSKAAFLMNLAQHINRI